MNLNEIHSANKVFGVRINFSGLNLNEIHSANKVFGVRINFSGQTGM